MRRSVRPGQTTVEFALAFSIFALLMFGVIEVGRAVYEKQALARAAETMVNTLAQADARNGVPVQPVPSAVSAAIAQANVTADLGLSTSYPSSAGIGSGYYNAGSRTCVTLANGGISTNPPCEFASNLDGHVVIVGLPDLGFPDTLVVSITVPYHSFLQYPLQFLGNQAQETVAATTLHGQVPQPGQS